MKLRQAGSKRERQLIRAEVRNQLFVSISCCHCWLPVMLCCGWMRKRNRVRFLATSPNNLQTIRPNANLDVDVDVIACRQLDLHFLPNYFLITTLYCTLSLTYRNHCKNKQTADIHIYQLRQLRKFILSNCVRKCF